MAPLSFAISKYEIVVVSQDDEFTYRYKDYELETIILNMLGEHQKENAALAITGLIQLV
jgi:dihydrofolate synthase/folylpolyglutamate synthase